MTKTSGTKDITKNKLNTETTASPDIEIFIKAILGRKAMGIVALDLRDLSSIADVFIICSGSSNRQVSAIADHIQVEMKKSGVKPIGVEGKKEGHWVLLDYADVIIHIFYEPIRNFYDLEGLWCDAKRIEVDHLVNTINTAE